MRGSERGTELLKGSLVLVALAVAIVVWIGVLNYTRQRTCDRLDADRAFLVMSTIKVKEPTTAEAQEVIKQQLALPKERNNTWGKRAEPYADFTSLRHPAYGPFMSLIAADGDLRAADGLHDG